jgi:2-methylisocitrate lyase-like PEP mutase family enzyme
MNQSDKAARFAELHDKGGAPLLLYNAWDAGSAKAIAAAGAPAIATSSWSVAEAHGYRDGQDIPLQFAEQIVARIAAAVDVPVSVDFEGGYSEDNAELADNAGRLIDSGVIGINFEDRVVQGTGLYDIERHASRILAIHTAAHQRSIELFINARTDLFLGQGRDPAGSITEAIERSKAYADAGASGFFIPGLQEEALIGQICESVTLPVNVMITDGVPSIERLTELGVARISWGPISYLQAMTALEEQARQALSPPVANLA